MWCGVRDLNPHDVSRRILSPLRIPISPTPHRRRIILIFQKIIQPIKLQAAPSEAQLAGYPAGMATCDTVNTRSAMRP